MIGKEPLALVGLTGVPCTVGVTHYDERQGVGKQDQLFGGLTLDLSIKLNQCDVKEP